MQKAKEVLTKEVMSVLSQDFVGTRLKEATSAVVAGLVRNRPELLTAKETKEVFAELVWDCAAREGY